MVEHRSLLEKFIMRLDVVDICGCWFWTGALSGKNRDRGVMRVGKKMKFASHVSIFLAIGHWPKTPRELVCHSCDHPKCVRPSHLFLGTMKQNRMDAIIKGRQLGMTPAKIKKIRLLAQAATQSYVARLIGCSQSAVSRHIRGRR